MKLDLPNSIHEELIKKHPFLTDYIDNQDLGRSEDIFYPVKTYKDILSLYEEFVKDKDENYYQHKNYFKAIEDLKVAIISGSDKLNNKAKSLLEMHRKITAYFFLNLNSNCWIYMDGFGIKQPYLLRNISYYQKDRNREQSIVEFELSANGGNRTVRFTTDGMRRAGRSHTQLLEDLGIFLEEDSFLSDYRKREADYLYKKELFAKQMIKDGIKYISDDLYESKNERWGYNKSEDKSKKFGTLSSSFSGSGDLCENPTLCLIQMFNLSSHTFERVPSYLADVYEFDATIEKKLILPTDHKDLIDILLGEELGDIGGDIIEGKGKATIILTKGSAGLGKTATSEIYSEKKELPLYSVHSGQLGIDGESIEKKLKEILEKAERWGCILLIDEADVYIRKRDNDVNHNAIVATFLRTMEYYKGTMFMTTNRTDDVDEAIESRCTAVLKYAMPNADMSLKLWKLFCNQFNVGATDETIEEVASKISDLSGRDIKNIVMLVRKYSLGKGIEKPDASVFKTCATFRGKYAI